MGFWEESPSAPVGGAIQISHRGDVMKLTILPNNDDSYTIRIVYEKEEWEKLEEIYRSNNLERYTTSNGFDENITMTVYRYRDGDSVFSSIQRKYYDIRRNLPRLYLVDDINDPLVDRDPDGGKFNLAVFRVIPVRNGEQYIAEFRLRNLGEMINSVYKDVGLIIKLLVQELTKVKVKVKWSFETVR